MDAGNAAVDTDDFEQRWLTYKLRRWADARDKRLFKGGPRGTQLLRDAAYRIEELEARCALNR